MRGSLRSSSAHGFGEFGPTSALVNLAKHRGHDCNVPWTSFHVSPWGGRKLGSLGKGDSHFLSFMATPPSSYGLFLKRRTLDAQNTPRHTSNTPRVVVTGFLELTSVSSSPFSSRVQKVLGPLPSTRVCLHRILFSDSQVGRLCRQKRQSKLD